MLAAMLFVGMQVAATGPGNCVNGTADVGQRLACVEADYKATDALLNDVYAATLKKYHAYDDVVRRLQESHARFLTSREDSCAVKSVSDTDTLYRAVKLQCLADQNRLEIKGLQEDRPLP